MSLFSKMASKINVDLSKYVTILDDVSLDDLIPLETNNNLTAWKFKFDDRLLWLPSDGLSSSLDYAVLFKLMINAGLYNIYNHYDVIGDDTGLVFKALNITDKSIVDYGENSDLECVNKNIETIINPLSTTTPTKKVGIYISDCLDGLAGYDDYDEVITVTRGTTTDILLYSFLAMMQMSSSDQTFSTKTIVKCNDLILFKFVKIVNDQ